MTEVERKYEVPADFTLPELADESGDRTVDEPVTYRLTATYYDNITFTGPPVVRSCSLKLTVTDFRTGRFSARMSSTLVRATSGVEATRGPFFTLIVADRICAPAPDGATSANNRYSPPVGKVCPIEKLP